MFVITQNMFLALGVVLSLIVPNICRFFEINDLILNSIGGVLGWKLYNNFQLLLDSNFK